MKQRQMKTKQNKTKKQNKNKKKKNMAVQLFSLFHRLRTRDVRFEKVSNNQGQSLTRVLR